MKIFTDEWLALRWASFTYSTKLSHHIRSSKLPECNIFNGRWPLLASRRPDSLHGRPHRSSDRWSSHCGILLDSVSLRAMFKVKLSTPVTWCIHVTALTDMFHFASILITSVLALLCETRIVLLLFRVSVRVSVCLSLCLCVYVCVCLCPHQNMLQFLKNRRVYGTGSRDCKSDRYEHDYWPCRQKNAKKYREISSMQ